MQEITPLSAAQGPFYAGIDVGGTNTKIGVVDDFGRTVAYQSIPTAEEDGPADLIRRVGEAVARIRDEAGIGPRDLVAAGLGTPGPMDIPRGLVLDPVNLPHWRNFPVRDELARVTGLPVSFTNDANAAAYGEFWVGSGRQSESMIMLTLGTGVGGHHRGWPRRGGNQQFWGRVRSRHSGFSARCATVRLGWWCGELEAYASASAVADCAEKLLAEGSASSLRKRLAGGERLSTMMLAEEAEAGDVLSLEVILEAATYLGIGVTTLVHTIDPGAVILGGAMDFGGHDTEVGRKFLEQVKSEFRRRAFAVVAANTLIDYASLGNDAGYIGAAGISLRCSRRGSIASLR